MSLRHALLGFLNYGPMTGYELKKFFDTSVAHFWNAELSQIYPSLKQMESEGLVDMQVDVQEDRPNRKVYTITADGREELIDWLAKPAETEQIREPVLIKVFFGANLKREELIEVLRERIEGLRRGIAYLQGCGLFVDRFSGGIGLKKEALFWALTPKLGIKQCEAEIEWAEEAIETLQAMGDSAFDHCHQGNHMEVRTAMEIFDRIKAAVPQLSASAAQTAKEGASESVESVR